MNKKKCSNHPGRQALSFCQCCKNYLCEECLIEGPVYYYCKSLNCLENLKKEIDYSSNPRFCQQCIAETTEESSGDVVTVNFIFGEKFTYDGREECPVCLSVIVEKRGAFFKNKGSYRVIWLDSDRSRFISRKLKEST